MNTTNATTHNTTTHKTTTHKTTPLNRLTTDRSAHSHRRRNVLVAACALSMLAVTSCNAADRRELGEQDIHDSLASHVEQVVEDRSLSIGDSLDCTSNIGLDSHVSASCVGTASSGQAVSASFTGTADVDAETCTALLVIDIAGDRIVDQPSVQCFDAV